MKRLLVLVAVLVPLSLFVPAVAVRAAARRRTKRRSRR